MAAAIPNKNIDPIFLLYATPFLSNRDKDQCKQLSKFCKEIFDQDQATLDLELQMDRPLGQCELLSQKRGFFLKIRPFLRPLRYRSDFPRPLKLLPDLFTRYKQIRRFSPEIADLLDQDYSLKVLICRCTSFFHSRGRDWMVLHSTHMEPINRFWDQLQILSEKKKIALAVESSLANEKGLPLEGYVMGVESPLVRLFQIATVGLLDLPGWKAPVTAEEHQKTHAIIFQYGIPYKFFTQAGTEEITASVKSSNKVWQEFQSDSFFQKSLQTMDEKIQQGKYTDEIFEKVLTLFLTVSKNKIIHLLKALFDDAAEQFVQENKYPLELLEHLRSYGQLSPELKEAYRNKSLSRLKFTFIAMQLRNADWAENIGKAVLHVPNNVPHVLACGAEHTEFVVPYLQAGFVNQKVLSKSAFIAYEAFKKFFTYA